VPDLKIWHSLRGVGNEKQTLPSLVVHPSSNIRLNALCMGLFGDWFIPLRTARKQEEILVNQNTIGTRAREENIENYLNPTVNTDTSL